MPFMTQRFGQFAKGVCNKLGIGFAGITRGNIYSQSWAAWRSRWSSRRRTPNWSVVGRMSHAWTILCTISHLYSLQGATEGSCRWRSEVIVVWGSQIGKITFCDAGDASESRLR
jgi:hypothetical protein